MQKLLFLLKCCIFWGLFVSSALSHKVILDVFSGAGIIEGEVGLSNGQLVTNKWVQVLDAQDVLLTRVQTDDEGYFTYNPPKFTDYTFFIDLSSGHQAKTTIKAKDINNLNNAIEFNKPKHNSLDRSQWQDKAQDLNKDSIIIPSQRLNLLSLYQPPRSDPAEQNMVKFTQVLNDVKVQLRQLRLTFKNYKEQKNMQTILGGVGYIVGLLGLWAYIISRQTAIKNKATHKQPQGS